MSSAIITIPVFRPGLREAELLSLEQCLKVLGGWPVSFVSPEGLDLSAVLEVCGGKVGVTRFPGDYFRSVADYNRLMLSRGFYEAFDSYEYMLLYQLDAFVFRDDLSEWCRKGYDYIGAPAFHAEGFEALRINEAEKYSEALSSHRLVFNGGLSLRKIAAMKRLLKLYGFFYPSWKGNEDMLFSLDSTRLLPLKPFVKLPGWKEALHFSFEKSPAASYGITGEKLPFGCHAWERYDPGFWSAFIGQDQARSGRGLL